HCQSNPLTQLFRLDCASDEVPGNSPDTEQEHADGDAERSKAGDIPEHRFQESIGCKDAGETEDDDENGHEYILVFDDPELFSDFCRQVIRRDHDDANKSHEPESCDDPEYQTPVQSSTDERTEWYPDHYCDGQTAVHSGNAGCFLMRRRDCHCQAHCQPEKRCMH